MARSDPSHPSHQVPAGVLLIPGALAVLTTLTVLLTIRTPGFAVLAGLLVFVTTLGATLLLQAIFGRDDGPQR